MLKTQIIPILCLFAFMPVAQAKDVSAQQAGVEYARTVVEKADKQHKDDLQEVADSEKLLEDRKKAYEDQIRKLAADRKKAEQSKKLLQDANMKYNKAQAILDQAWKE